MFKQHERDGRKGGSSYRGSFDQLRHMDSPTDQRSQAVRGEHYDSLHSIARDTPAPVTSAPNVLRRPFQSSVVNANVGSSSSSASTPCASGGITPNGEHTMHARDTTTSSSDCLPLALDESRRPRIKLVNGMLHPSDVCARKITFIFKERMDENGYSWKNVSKETKDFYWNEFQKFFVWDESMSSAIKMAWQRKAAERYRALMCNLRKGKEKSIHVSDSAWKTWTEAWNSPEYKTRCEKATANRLTEIAGPGSGISRHTGGSISHSSHADRLRSRLGRDPRPFELFEVTHTKKGTSMLVDARAQSIKDRYLELVEQASQTQEGHDELPIMDETALYYEAVGGGKKNRVYGIGSQACSYYPQLSSSFSTGSSSETLQAEVRDLRQALTQVQDREERLQQTLSQVQYREERLQQSLLEMKEERDQYREEMMRQMKDMMMSFEKRILQQSQFTTQDSQPLTDDRDVDL